MTIWHIHLLNARNALTPIMAEVRAHARDCVRLVSDHMDLPRFDLIIRAGEDVIPEWGIRGHAPAPGLIEVTLAPDRASADHLRRVLVRGMHHLTRWDGPGYGRSLGEALVSEGLAGHFVTQVLGGPADQWDQTRPATGSLKQAANLWSRRDYDHAEWFFGRGKIRKWTGYGIGHRLVAEHLDEDETRDAAALVRAPADAFRPAMRRLMAADGVEEPDLPEAVEDAAEAERSETGTPDTDQGIGQADAAPKPE